MSTIPIKQKYKKRIRLKRKGQSEIIGGLIVLTLLFAFAVPLMINIYYSTIKTSEQAQQAFQQLKTQYNEKITITPLDPNNEAYIRAGWIPGVYINNTGTTQVTLVKLYLVDTYRNQIYTILDLRYARPDPITPIIKKMLINVTLPGTGEPPPPVGKPITLMPGESLLIVFNESIQSIAPHLVVLVESANGVIHPIIGQGGEQSLYPGRPGAGGTLAGEGAWRGIFSPQSGFKLTGYDELTSQGIVEAWRPKSLIYFSTPSKPDRPIDIDYYYSFIYEDSKYPGLYKIDIKVEVDYYYDYVVLHFGDKTYNIYDGYRVIIRGFVGTYDAGDNIYYGTYIFGFARQVIIYDDEGNKLKTFNSRVLSLGERGVRKLDFDNNGIKELAFYSYLNAPSIPYTARVNIDADKYDDEYNDSLVWTYMIARDISGVDYVKVTVKLNYYWTKTVGNSCPYWDTRDLKIFAIVVFEYDPLTGSWIITQYKNYGYTSEKPVQFQETAIFPLNHNGTYRVGLLIYDNYMNYNMRNDFKCWIDFTMSLEHIIVEYGTLNPLFTESPPLYILAIPDASNISDIGEYDFMNAYNLTDINTAKVLAQKTLLNKIIEELNYAGVAGYTILDNVNDACNLLFGDKPPKYAIIYWLQGAVKLSDVLKCENIQSEEDVAEFVADNHWVLVSPFGEPFGGASNIKNYNYELSITPKGNYTANITDIGIEYRQKAYAFYLFNRVKFQYQTYITNESLVVTNGTFYINETSTIIYYGTSSFWIYNPLIGITLSNTIGSGIILVNPVHIDWDYTNDGAVIDTVVQQTVYSSLSVWRYLVSNY